MAIHVHAGRRKRWRREIVERLEDFPRQYAALEAAMAAFGEKFSLAVFEQAFDTSSDLSAYNRVQALERALTRVQNFVAELSIAAAKLAELQAPSGETHISEAVRAFASLRAAGVIDRALFRRLAQAQHARAMIEHSYTRVTAADVHAAAELVWASSREFVGRFRAWVEPYLEDETADAAAPVTGGR